MSTPSARIRAAASAMRDVLQIHEGIEGVPQPAARRAAIVRSIGVADHAKLAAVMQREQLGDEMRGRVFLKSADR